MKTLNFIVQASRSIGLGHLTRSAAVARELLQQGADLRIMLLADKFGKEAALNLGISYSESLPPAAGVVIVDAVEIGEVEASWLLCHSFRLIISPVFNRFDLATHVLVRHLPKATRASLPNYVSLEIDESFAFATAMEAFPSPSCYSKLLLGICLTGGVDFLDLESLLKSLANVPNLIEIRLISNREILFSNRGKIRFYYSGFRHEPWRFLRTINLFLGGEGLMISESVAHGVPAISLLANSHVEKNPNLVESGAVVSFVRDPLDIEALTELLSDSAALFEMHQEAMKIALSRRQNSLPHKIIQISALPRSN